MRLIQLFLLEKHILIILNLIFIGETIRKGLRSTSDQSTVSKKKCISNKSKGLVGLLRIKGGCRTRDTSKKHSFYTTV